MLETPGPCGRLVGLILGDLSSRDKGSLGLCTKLIRLVLETIVGGWAC